MHVWAVFMGKDQAFFVIRQDLLVGLLQHLNSTARILHHINIDLTTLPYTVQVQIGHDPGKPKLKLVGSQGIILPYD